LFRYFLFLKTRDFDNYRTNRKLSNSVGKEVRVLFINAERKCSQWAILKHLVVGLKM
jgi:hypothetical protein